MRLKGALIFGLLLSTAWGGVARAESPQHFALEIKFGPYVPSVDQTNGLNGKTPFSDNFGDVSDPAGAAPSRGLLTLGEFDYQFFNRFGSLGIGIGAGYYRRTGPAFTNQSADPDPAKAQFCTVHPGAQGDSGPREYHGLNNVVVSPPDSCFSGDENVFNIVPLSLLAVYRFDVLDKRFRIPLIPYIKLGLGYYIWWLGNSGSFVSQVSSKDANGNSAQTDASGATIGFVLNPGLALDLSALDPAASRAIDQEIGLNRVTAFIEMHGAWIQGCGCTNAMKLNLSDLTFTAGLGFEF
jgi:hypothetical protein